MWVKVARNCKPKKKISLGASVALAGPLEQQAIGSEIGIEELDSVGSLLEKSESDCHLHLDRIKSSDDNNEVGEEQENKVTEDVESEEKNGEEKNGRVDVREPASSIRFAKMTDDVDEVLKDKGELPPPVYSTMIRGLGRECWIPNTTD